MLLFNAKGPDLISKEDFRIYQDLRPTDGHNSWSIASLFEYAIDENHPDHLRLLAWRDLLFQDNFIPPEAADYYHPTGQHCIDLLNLYDQDDGAALRTAFRGRPKLVREFAAQLLYNLDHSLMRREFFRHYFLDHCDGFIEALLPFVDQDTGKALWKYHSCSSVRTDSDRSSKHPDFKFQTYFKHLALCQPDSNMPKWLTNTLYRDIAAAVKQDCKHLPASNTVRLFDTNSSIQRVAYPALSATICHLLYLDPRKDAEYGTRLISLIEHANLPHHYLYLNLQSLQHLAPLLTNDHDTYRLLRRHLIPLSDRKISKLHPVTYSKNSQNFLLWASGFVQHLQCSNVHKPDRDVIISIIDNIHRTAKSSGKFCCY